MYDNVFKGWSLVLSSYIAFAQQFPEFLKLNFGR